MVEEIKSITAEHTTKDATNKIVKNKLIKEIFNETTLIEEKIKIEKLKEQQEKQKLMQQYEVFKYVERWDKEINQNVLVPTNINYPRLAKLLMFGDKRKYIVLKDNQEIYVYNGSYYEPIGQGIIENRVSYYLDDLTKSHIKKEVVSFIKNYEYVDREQLNPPLSLINVKNGIYNIDTRELIPHSPDYYFLNEIPINYNPEAKIEKINDFHKALLNLDDLPILQEFYGDCLQRDYRHKKALMNVGVPDTGKSKLLELMGKFLGKNNTNNATLHELCKDKYAPVELYGKHANISADIGNSSIRQIQMFLMLTGRDMIRGQKKYGQPFNFENHAKLIFSCNQIPDTEVKSDAYYNRWLVLEYNNVFDDETKNPNIIAEITTEKEMSGLFNYAIEGLYRLNDNKGYSAHRTLDEVKEYMTKGHNPIKEFVDVYIDKDPKNNAFKDSVYKCYYDFCSKNNYPIKESNVFSRKFKPLAPMSIEESHSGNRRTWKGIRCNYEIQNDSSNIQQKVIED